MSASGRAADMSFPEDAEPGKTRGWRVPRGGHAERHRSDRIGWLRAAVLGANDGIVSTASLVLGVATAGVDHRTLLLTSVSGLVAGAMSMAAGDFVSVHSQADAGNADLTREKAELKANPQAELRELTCIYVQRGLAPDLADQVAQYCPDRLLGHWPWRSQPERGNSPGPWPEEFDHAEPGFIP